MASGVRARAIQQIMSRRENLRVENPLSSGKLLPPVTYILWKYNLLRNSARCVTAAGQNYMATLLDV